MKLRRLLVAAALPLVALVGSGVKSVQAAPAPCQSWIVDYALAPGSQLKIEGTPFGAGNGTFPLGPGTLRLRERGNASGPTMHGKVEVVSYAIHAHVPITTDVLGLKTTVVSDTETTVSPDHCGNVARGLFDGPRLLWTTPFRLYRTDGTITCHGSMCGRFGAPPPGKSQIHIPPRPVHLMNLQFRGSDVKHFTSAFILVDKTKSPQSRTSIRLVGHEVAQRCAPPPACH